ncbi:MAG: prephenate dehydratase [Deltaproteobacteria bacterium]|nr:prephenate dehydratase [Deltaproteobacteria bacterium]
MDDIQKNLADLREKIDAIDDRLLELLNERARYVLEVGRTKHSKPGARFHVLEREESIYERLTSSNPGPFPTQAIRPVFREIISASLNMEKTMRVVCLGPEATFSHMAAVQQFGQAIELTHTVSIADIFDEVERGRADYGVVPIENSTEGVVNVTLDMFIDSPLQICSEILLQISHSLLSNAVRLEDIRVVYSHPQALAQCCQWLKKHLPGAAIEEATSTAMAAMTVRDNPAAAAIASRHAARAHAIPVLMDRIEDNPYNSTRFWVIGIQGPGRTGQDKTSLMFSIKDGVGALHNMLEPFGKHGINLTKIESRPSRTKPWEYIFFIDIAGHTQDAPVASALAELSGHAAFMKVLGSYPRGGRR